MKVLLVEDEPSHAKLAHAVLTAAGVSVTHVAAAEAALNAMARERPDAILLDLQLPGMSGLEFARELRRQARDLSVPIIACTAYSNTFSAQSAREAGCDCFLEKPLDTRTLVSRLQAAVEGSG